MAARKKRKYVRKAAQPQTRYIVGQQYDGGSLDITANDLHGSLKDASECCFDQYDENAVIVEVQVVALHKPPKGDNLVRVPVTASTKL